MTNARPQRGVLWPALRRFWLVALVAALAAGFATTTLVRATATTTWAGEATYVVPIADPPVANALGVVPATDPRVANSSTDALRFAQVYSILLVEDGALLTVLAEATGLSRSEVAEATEAVPVADSPVIRVSFSADTEAQVVDYYQALEAAFEASPAISPNIRPGNIRLLQSPAVFSQPGLAPLATALGVLAAILVGLGGAVLLERLDPRLRSDADLRELADWPVLPAPRTPGDARVDVLVERVVRAAPTVRTVAVVGLAGVPTNEVREITERFAAVHSGQVEAAARQPLPGEDYVSRGGAGLSSARIHTVEWVPGGSLGASGAAERLTQEVDVVVLLAPVGSRLSRLDLSVRSLQDLSVDPVVVAIVPRPSRRRGGPTQWEAPSTPADPVSWTDEDDPQQARSPVTGTARADGDQPGTDRQRGEDEVPAADRLSPRR